MCVLPSLRQVSCTRWANIESLFFEGFRPWASGRVGGGHVKAASGSCLSGNIWTQQSTFAMPSDFAVCLSWAGLQVLFPGADTRSFLCEERRHHCGFEGYLDRRTEDRNDRGSTYTGSFRTTIVTVCY